MNKSFTRLGFFLFSLWGIFILSCGSTPIVENEQDSNSSENTKSIQANKASTTKKEKTKEEAFEEVVNVLHAPYNSGEKFFKIFTGTSEINETKNGSTVSVKDGDSSITGKGTWTVKAGKDDTGGNDKDDSIVYTYTGFQPKGSKIIIDGKMISMYRSKELNGTNKDAIGFHKNGTATKKNGNGFEVSINGTNTKVEVGKNGVKEIKDPTTNGASYLITLADTLKISGDYQATLEFIYPSTGIHSDVADSNYDTKLIDDQQGMFTVAGSSIEFTYNGKTEKLTKEQIKKLIIVA